MSSEKAEVLQGTLDLMILKTLHALGPAAWVWNRETYRTGERGCAELE